MMMPEAERQFYLGKAGIHLWYARKALPGAAPSPEFAFPEKDEPELDAAAIAPPPVPARPSVPQRKVDGVGKDRIAGIQALMADYTPEPAGLRFRRGHPFPSVRLMVSARTESPASRR